MTADEETSARAVLTEMQMRISQGPQSALGLGDSISVEQVRAAFLQLTKQFHPARFGRMSSDVQRLSNEVFLGIKSAHELLMRTLGVSARGGAIARNQSGSMPVMAEGSTKTSLRTTEAMPPTTQPNQFARGTDRAPHGPGVTPSAAPNRTGTPPMGVPISAVTATPPRTGTPPMGVPIMRPAMPATATPHSASPG